MQEFMFPTQTIVQSSNLVIVYIHDISYTRIQFYHIHSFINTTVFLSLVFRVKIIVYVIDVRGVSLGTDLCPRALQASILT